MSVYINIVTIYVVLRVFQNKYDQTKYLQIGKYLQTYSVVGKLRILSSIIHIIFSLWGRKSIPLRSAGLESTHLQKCTTTADPLCFSLSLSLKQGEPALAICLWINLEPQRTKQSHISDILTKKKFRETLCLA